VPDYQGDERRQQQDYNTFISDIATIKTQVGQVLDDIVELKQNFITTKEFMPVKIIAYGFVGIVMTSVVVSLIALILKKGV
jgi:hypothetical protein